MKALKIGIALACLTSPSLAEVHICTGQLFDNRGSGITLGDCDLNDLSPAEYKRIVKTCGEPNAVPTGKITNKSVCNVRAIVEKKPDGDRLVATRVLSVAAKH